MKNNNEWMNLKLNAAFLTDSYKVGHHLMYPEGTVSVYSNLTPRANRHAPVQCKDGVVVFGTQLALRQLHEKFEEEFFSQDKDTICGEIKRELSMHLNQDYDVSHFEALHDLGYLPIKVKSLDEGTLVPIKVPMLTIVNTRPEFFWVTNFLETILSNLLWKGPTSATIARAYRKVLNHWQQETNPGMEGFVDFQGHDFSMRGLDGVEPVIASGLGHLVFFKGSDSLPTIHGARKYYDEEGFICGSVNATEHSVMCAGDKDNEVDTIARLIETFPKGILSVVSDTWDLWKVLTVYLPALKEQIMQREGKFVVRPDSGDPVDILCGTNNFPVYEDEKDANDYLLNLASDYSDEIFQIGDTIYEPASEYDFTQFLKDYGYEQLQDTLTDIGSATANGLLNPVKFVETPATKGVIELLWDTFGGTVNEQGYKVLDPHIGAIYGDSITIDRAEAICARLAAKGFASTNVVLGIGSFTYQFNTRDTFGFAVKATYVEVDGEGREIFKDPITDDGAKKSAKGLLAVDYNDSGEIALIDQVDWAMEDLGLLKVRYQDGEFFNSTTLTEIRERVQETL